MTANGGERLGVYDRHAYPDHNDALMFIFRPVSWGIVELRQSSGRSTVLPSKVSATRPFQPKVIRIPEVSLKSISAYPSRFDPTVWFLIEKYRPPYDTHASPPRKRRRHGAPPIP